VISFTRRAQLIGLAAGLPAILLSLWLLRNSPYPLLVRAGLAAVAIGAWLWVSSRLVRHVATPLQTVSNLLAAIREDDFSIRARDTEGGDALATVMLEINALSDTLRSQRLGAQEATALLRGVMAEIDVAIFAFDNDARLVLVNRYGERLLDGQARHLLGQRANALGLEAVLSPRTGVMDATFPGGSGRWEVRQRRFWQGGIAHHMVVLADVSQPLRQQERDAWLRLIRVIGHELNNSLAPIKSIAGSLESLIARTPPPDDWRTDMQRGLAIIASRADALNRFTTAYAALARLPAPIRRTVAIGALIRRVAALDGRLMIRVQQGPDISCQVDADQLEQLLINVMRNAVDASLETHGSVVTGWETDVAAVRIWVDDEGPGLQSTANLFVPFFTTKPGGSGIGLALSQQIAEAHGGVLTLANRDSGRGVRATLTLPR
jgi:two-component system nitrogen regulation sensor histidine kinase NtrY